MSFFNDIFNMFEVNDQTKNLTISYVENKGAMIVGKFKILTMNEEKILLKSEKNKIGIIGENLIIKSVAKGEILIFGKILNIDCGGGKSE